MKINQLRYYYFFGLLLGVLVLSFLIFMPFLKSIAVAVAFSVVLQPLYKKLVSLFGGRTVPAALVTILFVVVVFLIPITFITTRVVSESLGLSGHISGTPQTVSDSVATFLENKIHNALPSFAIDLHKPVRDVFIQFGKMLAGLFEGTVHTMVNIFLGLIALFFLLRDGHTFVRNLVILSPLSDNHDVRIFQRLEIAITSILRGSVVVSLLYGTLSGIGLAIFGVPSATLWGCLAAIASLIPTGAIVTVLLPATAYLFITGNTSAGIGLLIWSGVCIAIIDNYVVPRLVGHGVKIHHFFVLFSVIGGIEFFGPVGFLLGPLVLSFLFALLDIYKFILVNEGEGKL